jgi:hypothetical protein
MVGAASYPCQAKLAVVYIEKTADTNQASSDPQPAMRKKKQTGRMWDDGILHPLSALPS